VLQVNPELRQSRLGGGLWFDSTRMSLKEKKGKKFWGRMDCERGHTCLREDPAVPLMGKNAAGRKDKGGVLHRGKEKCRKEARFHPGKAPARREDGR